MLLKKLSYIQITGHNSCFDFKNYYYGENTKKIKFFIIFKLKLIEIFFILEYLILNIKNLSFGNIFTTNSLKKTLNLLQKYCIPY